MFPSLLPHTTRSTIETALKLVNFCVCKFYLKYKWDSLYCVRGLCKMSSPHINIGQSQSQDQAKPEENGDPFRGKVGTNWGSEEYPSFERLSSVGQMKASLKVKRKE